MEKVVKIIEKETVWDGFYKMLRIKLKHDLFRGGMSEEYTRELMDRPNAVAVLLHDPVEDVVILIEQFRVGAIESDNPWLLELVAGLVEPGESEEDVARREAKEESGAQVNDVEKIATFYNSAGGSNEKTTVFYAAINSAGINGIHGLDYENEDILVRRLPTGDLFDLLAKGELPNASLVVAAQWLRINQLASRLT